MKNLKMVVASAVLVFGAMAAQAVLSSVILTQNSYSYDVGGEFNANTTQNFMGNYAPSAIVGTGFETFCIETMVDFYPGQQYTYTLGSVDSRGVSLSLGAAYLYTEFAKGELANFDYIDPATRNADAGLLQAAIWWFQGEQTYSGYPASPIGNVYYENALNALGGWANADVPNDGYYKVDVLQMWSGKTAAQNQLVLVPDSGSTTAMFGLGLSALALVRRRVKAS